MSKLLNYTEDVMLASRQHGFTDDFKSITPRQLYSYRYAGGAAGADLAATVIMAVPHAIVIHGVSITPDGSAAGVDGSNTSAWTVTDGTNTIVTKTYTTDFPADNTEDSLGTIAFRAIAAGGRVELAVTNGTTADLTDVLVTIAYTPLAGLPNDNWVATLSDDGNVSISDAVGGICAITPSDSTAGDNDEAYIGTAKEFIKFASDKPFFAEALIQFSEANTDDANVIFGLCDAVGANTLQDNGGGPPASYSGAVIFKADGGTVWQAESSLATAQVTTVTTTTAGGSSYQRLGIEFLPLTSTLADVIFYVDGVAVAKHSLTYTSATEMQLVLGVKNGGTNAETLNVDYATYTQLR